MINTKGIKRLTLCDSNQNCKSSNEINYKGNGNVLVMRKKNFKKVEKTPIKIF